MDSILIIKIRQDLQDQQDIIPTRVPDETGYVHFVAKFPPKPGAIFMVSSGNREKILSILLILSKKS